MVRSDEGYGVGELCFPLRNNILDCKDEYSEQQTEQRYRTMNFDWKKKNPGAVLIWQCSLDFQCKKEI